MSKYTPAYTLDEIAAVFDPVQPLLDCEIDSFYVERANSPWREMKALLHDSSQSRRPVRILLTGNTGSGKSTELNKLIREAGKQFRVVIVRMEHILPPLALHSEDLIVMAAVALTHIDRAGAPPRLLQEISQYMMGSIFERRINLLQQSDSTERDHSYTVEFNAFYRKGPATHATTREVNDRLSDLLSITNALIDKLATPIKPLLLVFDDTDKVAFADAVRIFFDHSAVLADIRVSTIYTVPSGLWYSARMRMMGDIYAGSYRLSEIPLYTNMSMPDMAGRAALDSMIARRMSPELMTNDAREQIVEDSKGRVRHLIGLVHFAAVNAVGRKASRIEQSDADRAASWLSEV